MAHLNAYGVSIFTLYSALGRRVASRLRLNAPPAVGSVLGTAPVCNEAAGEALNTQLELLPRISMTIQYNACPPCGVFFLPVTGPSLLPSFGPSRFFLDNSPPVPDPAFQCNPAPSPPTDGHLVTPGFPAYRLIPEFLTAVFSHSINTTPSTFHILSVWSSSTGVVRLSKPPLFRKAFRITFFPLQASVFFWRILF